MQLRIPSGTRDLVGDDVRKKRWLQKTIHQVFESYGYQEVMTPAFEYYQLYNEAFASLRDREMYKFFDENGDILALRMDMTVPIARMAATRFKDTPLPLRFSYSSNVYKVRKVFAGKRTEVMDSGIELIGNDETNDLEVLCCALDTMEALKLDQATLEISDVNFFRLAAARVFENEEDIAVLADLIDRKSMVELETFLDGFPLDEKVRQFFLDLPWLSGKVEVLDRACDLAFDEELKDVVRSLRKIQQDLCRLGYGDRITFDLGKLPHLNYYTSLIFEGFASGVGNSILSGGRYDSLMGRFGKEANARGFSLKLDYLLDLVPVLADEPLTKIYYPVSRAIEAFEKARELRHFGKVELVEWDQQEIAVEEVDE